MDPRTLLDTAAPTPYGWVITTQNQFDLETILAFRSQLASLSRFFESQPSVAPHYVSQETEVITEVSV